VLRANNQALMTPAMMNQMLQRCIAGSLEGSEEMTEMAEISPIFSFLPNALTSWLRKVPGTSGSEESFNMAQ
jgi:hypothetical protein